MAIKIEVSQRGEYPEGDGKVVYFAKDTTAEFSLDGNADNAQMMAGYAIGGIINAHRGDVLLIDIHLHGHRVARWVGRATAYAAEEFSEFVNGFMRDFNYTCMRIHNTRAAGYLDRESRWGTYGDRAV